jgi:hypothetical protein
MTLGYVLVNTHCGHKARGSIMGINCLFGAIALLILAKLGGLAFDKIDKSVPFLFAAVSSAILFLVILITRSKIDEPPRHLQNSLHHSQSIAATSDVVHNHIPNHQNDTNVDEKI